MSGYYGCGNAGDEAVLAGIKQAFRATGAAARLVALSQNPESTRRLHGLDAEYRMNMRSVRTLLKRSDLLLSGGGSLLQDTTSLRSLVYYVLVIRMALNAGVPVMFYAQGLGPLRRSLARWLVRLAANRASYITVRDEPSLRLLRSIGVDVPPIEVTADPAFALRPASVDSIRHCWASESLPTESRPKVGVSLRGWGPPNDLQCTAYAELLTAIVGRTGGEIILVPMQVPADRNFSDTVCTKVGTSISMVRGEYSPEVLLGLVGSMDVVVAMRLHALIFAARTGVPPFALSYDPKVDSLMQGLDLSGSVAPWTGFSPDEVAGRVGSLLDERESRSAALGERALRMERLALRNAEIALSLVQSGPTGF